MLPFIAKTFGGLSKEYYFRQFLFGLLFFAFFTFLVFKAPNGPAIQPLIFFVVNLILYPYSRFVYESLVGFVMGRNIFIIPIFLMLFVKMITMMICFMFAVFIAPFGLAYLYFRHSRQAGNG